MKKLLPFLLCAAILLAGCTNASESEASSSSETSSVSETVSSEETSDAASSEAQSESSEEAQTANLESAVAALEAVNPIENPLTYTDFDVENTLMLTLDNLVAYKGDVSNNQADCGLVFVAQAKEGKVADVEAELQAYKESLTANDMYVEFADKMALAKEARIVTNGNYVAMVIASVGVGDYTEIDQTLETALNF
ncbi:DUF4358 domain-containing protein [uncultured Subdoligranulum sp.]|uniref:DUF4358 domain-containing protein n=1 Tax=uncultured Subdoligranulum sp. TaxID=512298 RepID=UPI00260AAED2|nr:DUF4358 domain-containing protein [uncultured Subdoligranulum sp.]